MYGTTSTFADNLNLDLAWKRVMHSHKDRSFVSHPFIDSWLDFSRNDWLDHLRSRLRSGYSPTIPTTCWVPKGNNLCRQGVILTPQDETIYFALIDFMLPQISTYVYDSETVALHPRLVREHSGIKLVEHYKRQWAHFRDVSLDYLNNGYPFMVKTDITSFYSSISIKNLFSILMGLGIEREACNLLSKCLNTWAGDSSTGIPQGYIPSDILSLVFLAETDITLQRSGVNHMRYSDDIRIFAVSDKEARSKLHELDRLLLSRRLSLNSAKTRILYGSAAVLEVRGHGAKIETLNHTFGSMYGNVVPGIGPYTPFWEVEEAILGSKVNEFTRPIIENMFDNLIEDYENGDLNTSLLRYLLPWLRALNSSHAIEPCKKIIVTHPNEAKTILKYFKKFSKDKNLVDFLLLYANDTETVYEYSLFEIAKWLYETGSAQREVIQWAVNLVKGNYSPYVKSYALAILGRSGDHTDLEFLYERYHSGLDEIGKAETLHSISRMEPSRRNRFYNQVENEGFFIRMALKYVRASSHDFDLLFPTHKSA